MASLSLRWQVFTTHMSANLAILRASIPRMTTLWAAFMGLFTTGALAPVGIVLGKIALVTAAVWLAVEALKAAYNKMTEYRALDTDLADKTIAAPNQATEATVDALTKKVATGEKLVYNLNRKLNGQRIEAFIELKEQELEITKENLEKTKALQMDYRNFLTRDQDIAAILAAAAATAKLTKNREALAVAEATVAREATRSLIVQEKAQQAHGMSLLQNGHNINMNALKEEYNNAIQNTAGLALEESEANTTAVLEKMRQQDIRFMEQKIAYTKQNVRKFTEEVQKINAKQTDLYNLTPKDVAEKTQLAGYVKQLLGDVVSYETLIARIQAAKLGELPEILDGNEKQVTALGKVVGMMETKLNSMNIQLARARGGINGVGKAAEVTEEFISQMGERLDESGVLLKNHADFGIVATKLRKIAAEQDKFNTSATSARAFKTLDNDATRFVESMGYATAKLRAFREDYAKAHAHFSKIATGIGFGEEQVTHARKMLEFMERMQAVTAEKMISRQTDALFNREAKALIDAQKLVSKSNDPAEIIAEYDQRIEAQKKFIESTIAVEGEGSEYSIALQKRLTEFLAIEVESRSAFVRKTIADDIAKTAPMLAQLEKQYAKKGDWSSQKTRGGKLQAFDEQMKIELGRLEASAQGIEMGSVAWFDYQNRITKITEAGEQKRAEIAKGAFAGIVAEYEDTASLMENTMANALNGIADATMDFMMTGEDDWRNFATNVIKEIGRIVLMKQVISPIADALNGFIGGMFGGAAPMFSGSGNAGMPPSMGGGMTPTPLPPLRAMPSANAFAMPSQEDMGISAGVARNRLGDTVSRAGTGDIEVNLINNTGEPAEASAGKPRFDGRKMVLDIVLEAASKPGGFRDGMKGALG